MEMWWETKLNLLLRDILRSKGLILMKPLPCGSSWSYQIALLYIVFAEIQAISNGCQKCLPEWGTWMRRYTWNSPKALLIQHILITCTSLEKCFMGSSSVLGHGMKGCHSFLLKMVTVEAMWIKHYLSRNQKRTLLSFKSMLTTLFLVECLRRWLIYLWNRWRKNFRWIW